MKTSTKPKVGRKAAGEVLVLTTLTCDMRGTLAHNSYKVDEDEYFTIDGKATPVLDVLGSPYEILGDDAQMTRGMVHRARNTEDARKALTAAVKVAIEFRTKKLKAALKNLPTYPWTADDVSDWSNS